MFDTTTWTELRDENWQAHSGSVTALAFSNDQHVTATEDDTTLILRLLKEPADAAHVELLSFSSYHPAA